MKIKHLKNDYYVFTFDYINTSEIDHSAIVDNFLRQQTDSFYIIEENGFYTRPAVVVRVLDPDTLLWLKLLC